MNRKLSECIGYTVRANDGDVGTVERYYFDDVTWSLRYLAVKTNGAPARHLLLSVVALEKPVWTKRVFPVNLSMKQVRRSPLIDIDGPISRQYETELHEHYAWPTYWGIGYYTIPEFDMMMNLTAADKLQSERLSAEVRKLDPHLRSIRELVDCRVQATDGHIGHVEDALVDDETWSLRYLIVNTRDWLPGRRVLISPQWVTKLDWTGKEVFADLTREAVMNSPKYTPSKAVTFAYEHKLHDNLQKAQCMEWVLFKIHAPAGARVSVAGTFNNWDISTIQLNDHGNGLHTAMIRLPLGKYEFRYIINGEWCNAPDHIPQIPNVFGTTNSVLVVERQGVANNDGHLRTFSRKSKHEDQPMLGNWKAD